MKNIFRLALMIFAGATDLSAAEDSRDPLLDDVNVVAEARWNSVWNKAPELIVALDFTGKAAAQACFIEKTDVLSLEDEFGNSYHKVCHTSGRGYLDRRQFYTHKNGMHTEVTIPNRPSLKRIGELRGVLTVKTGGACEKIVIPNAFRNVEKPLADDRLKSLGVKIGFHYAECFSGFKKTRYLVIDAELHGKAVTDCRILDARNRPIDYRGCGFSQIIANESKNGDSDRVSFDFGEEIKIPSNGKLELTIHRNFREISIPFVVKDISIPKVPNSEYFERPASVLEEYAEASQPSPEDTLPSELKWDAKAAWTPLGFSEKGKRNLLIMISFRGEATDRIREYGELKIDSMIDENGNRLDPEFCLTTMIDKVPTKEKAYSVPIALVDAKCRRVDKLAGSVVMQLGIPTKPFFLHNAPIVQGGDATSDGLKELEISARFTPRKAEKAKTDDSDERSVVDFHWENNVVYECSALAPQGKVIEQGRFSKVWHPDEKRFVWQCGFRSELSDNTNFRLMIQKDRRKIRIPFELQGIEIPPLPAENEKKAVASTK